MNKKSNESSNMDLSKYKIDHKKRYYPFTIVWTPVPLISWLWPRAGHLGIGKSDGHVKDFAISYKVTTDSNLLGRPLKYWILDPSKAKGGIEGWDKAIEETTPLFCKKKNLVLVSNCHTHVSQVLNAMEYDGRTDYNEKNLYRLFNKNFKYVSLWTFVKVWFPFALIVTLIGSAVYFKFYKN